jgi:hypothetical protein
MSRVHCDGTRHLILADVYPGGLWSESSPYPYRTDVVGVEPCDCPKLSDPPETIEP